MKTHLAILVGKIILFITRSLKIGGGSAAPGLFALRLDPELIVGLSKKIPKNIVITGTNGKTTTAGMIAHFAKTSGLKVIRNHTGSNLERGIASTLINSKGKFDLGVWELDEVAFNTVAPKLKPDVIVFLNISRDQLDRYGEIDKVVNKWYDAVSKLDPKTIILIHPNLAKLKNYFKGIKELEKPQNIKTKGLEGSSFEIRKLKINLPIPGLYNIQNASAAISAAQYLNIPITSLTNFQGAFGRFEKLPFGYIFLIKNPAGATQVFETIAPQIERNDRMLLALNDNFADGIDVSWIWDGEFENLKSQISNVKCICSGTRAQDLAIRLKYAGFDPKYIQVENDLKKALQRARDGLKGKLFILPTYTALLELQLILTNAGIKKHYWEES